MASLICLLEIYSWRVWAPFEYGQGSCESPRKSVVQPRKIRAAGAAAAWAREKVGVDVEIEFRTTLFFFPHPCLKETQTKPLAVAAGQPRPRRVEPVGVKRFPNNENRTHFWAI